MSEKHSKKHRNLPDTEKTSTMAGKVNLFLLCLTLILSTLFYGSVDSWATGLLFLLITLMFLGWVFDCFQAGEIRFSTNFVQIPIIGFIGIGLIQLLPLRNLEIPSDLLNLSINQSLSLNPYATGMFIVSLVIYLIFLGIALVFIENHKQLQKVSVIIIIFGTVMAFFAILQRLAETEGIYGIRPTPQSIPLGPFVNRHHFAAFMEMILAICFGLLFGNVFKKEKRFLLIFSMILMTVALAFSGSRSGFLSLLLIVLSTGLISFYRNKNDDESILQNRVAFWGGGVSLFLLIFGVVIYLGGADSLLRGLGVSEALKEDYTTGRWHTWQTAGQIILDNPILGTGLDSFGLAFTKYDTENGTLFVEYAHNEYLQTLSDAGILGFILLILFIFLLIRTSWKTIRNSHDRYRKAIAIGALAGCLGILFHSFFDFPLRTPSNALFFLILVALATIEIHSPKHSTKSP